MQNRPQLPPAPNDLELVAMVQNGHTEAFAALMERHQNSCQRLAYSILRDRSDAEDEVQNSFWKAFAHIGQFQHDAKFSTWLTRIVVNQCLMRLRRARRAKFLYMDDGSIGQEIATFDLPDAAQTPEEQLGKSQVATVLRAEIARIPPLLGKVFVLRDVEERPMQEVAEQLGISVAAAKSRLLRARSELRNRLQKHHGRLGLATLFA